MRTGVHNLTFYFRPTLLYNWAGIDVINYDKQASVFEVTFIAEMTSQTCSMGNIMQKIMSAVLTHIYVTTGIFSKTDVC